MEEEEEEEEEDTECIDSVKSMYFTDDWFDICRSRFWRSETSSWLFIVVKKVFCQFQVVATLVNV